MSYTNCLKLNQIHYNLDEIVERRAVSKSKIMDLFIPLFKMEINKLEKRGCEEKVFCMRFSHHFFLHFTIDILC